ncbi:MAG TPA: hypothetical protein DD477_10500 [Spirochaetaceae bacterium]|nr:hypothetical protein [Spirochaetaceae bacterium]
MLAGGCVVVALADSETGALTTGAEAGATGRVRAGAGRLAVAAAGGVTGAIGKGAAWTGSGNTAVSDRLGAKTVISGPDRSGAIKSTE